MDREKAYFVNGGKFTKMEMVCKALQQCTMPSDSEGYETQCGDCPYFDPDCSVNVCKQQLCDDTLALLKEQEAVEPKHNPLSPTDWFCGKCGMCISRFHDYCPSCGKAVKWE